MKAKIPTNRKCLFLKERLSELLISLRRFIPGNMGSTTQLDLPTLIRQSGWQSDPSWSDFWKDRLSGTGRPQGPTPPSQYSAQWLLKDKISGHLRKANWAVWAEEDKTKNNEGEKKESEDYHQIITNRWVLKRSINSNWEQKWNCQQRLRPERKKGAPRKARLATTETHKGLDKILWAVGPFSPSIDFILCLVGYMIRVIST